MSVYFSENHIWRLAFLEFMPLKAVILFLEFILSLSKDNEKEKY